MKHRSSFMAHGKILSDIWMQQPHHDVDVQVLSTTEEHLDIVEFGPRQKAAADVGERVIINAFGRFPLDDMPHDMAVIEATALAHQTIVGNL